MALRYLRSHRIIYFSIAGVAIGIMVMIVVVGVYCEPAFGERAEQFEISRIAGHGLGTAGAADMMIETDHRVRRGHDQM